ncbi:MAG: sulfatase-like hydrolase/transferase [Verrucomicrobiales bacterium]|nr:sulfatase-like hydrolase/transferase [Verrucomicrobiales bacterium]
MAVLSAPADTAKPDFVFFLTDDISAGDLAVYREGRPKLPNLRRLADRGMVFENFYVATSSCSPSRCSFITGRYPHNHGAPGLHQPLPAGQVMFPAVLQRAGYYTALAGKNHMGPQPGKHAFTEVFKGAGVSRAEDWVSIYRNRPKDRPCFLWLASDDAHRDWQPDANFRKPDVRSVTVPPYLFDDGETRGDLANYEAEVGRTDYFLGQLLDELDSSGRLDSTYVIYTSDNGRPFPRCKTHLFDSGTRVPFIISGPGIPRGTRAGTLASAIDLAATVCQLAGVESPRTKRFQGASMVPVLRNPALSHRSVVFAERNWHITRAHERMVREGPWMYIWNAWPDSRVYGPETNVYFPAGKSLRAAFEKGKTKPHQNFPYIWPRPAEQLFHVERDPHQLEDLADNSFYTPVRQRLQGHLSSWKEETGDSVPESKKQAGKAGPGPGADRNAPEVNKPGPCLVDADGVFLTEADDSVRFDWGKLQGPRYEPLKPGAVVPDGWLREQLETMAAGLTGNLDTAYEKVVGDRNGWLGGDGDGWERGPYWIDGLLPLAHLLQDEKLLAKSNRWIEWTLLNQKEDGYIGPIPFESPPAAEPGLQKDRRRDWWPKMVMLKILQQHYLATGDERVLTCLDRYFRFQLRELPKTPLGHWSYWATRRAGDNIHIVHWLYSLTREPYLLELSDLLIKQGYPWTRDFQEGDKVKEFRHTVHHGSGSGYHCVNLAHALKTPVLEWQRQGDIRSLEALDNGIRLIREYHGQPHSLWGGDEGMHGTSPNRGSEFCTASEALYSLALNFANTGRVDFADWSDRVVYNVLKTQANSAFTRRQYFQQANQIDCSVGEHPFLNHYRSANVFGLLSGYPCCTCNMHQAWPKFASHLWMKSADGGVAAFSYAPSTVTVPVQGKTIRITTVTSYPRRDGISLSISADAGSEVEFPVHLRIPGWAHGAHVSVNGESAGYPQAATMAVIRRAWKDGDVIDLVLPSEVSITRGHQNSASVHKGPLLFALPLPAVEKELADREVTELRLQDEKVIWNYALFEKDLNPRPVRLRKFQVSDNGKDDIRIQCYAVKQPRWTSYHGESGPLPPSPSDFPDGQSPAKIELVPYADTRLRISVFPTVN